MRIILLISLMMAAATLVAGTTLYRWVDDQGRIHYSDQPQPHAEQIEVGEPMTYHREKTGRERQQTGRTRADTTTGEEFPGYDSISITAPKTDQILWNIGSTLTVNLSVQPTLQPDHSFRVSYNGAVIDDWPARATSHQIKNVYRGTHTVSVSIIDATGNQVAAGGSVTFYVKQTSVLN